MNQEELNELYFAALEAEEAGEYEKALEMFRRGAEYGDTSAYNMIGIAYDSGHGVEQDKCQAIEWFKKAWNDGENLCYIANIASTYAEIGDLEQADEWWNKAIEGDDKSAPFDYAKFLVEQNRYESWEQIVQLVEVTATAEARLEVTENEKEAAQKLLKKLRRAQTSDEKSKIWRAYGKSS